MFPMCVRWCNIRWKFLGQEHVSYVASAVDGWHIYKDACLCVKENKVVKRQSQPFD